MATTTTTTSVKKRSGGFLSSSSSVRPSPSVPSFAVNTSPPGTTLPSPTSSSSSSTTAREVMDELRRKDREISALTNLRKKQAEESEKYLSDLDSATQQISTLQREVSALRSQNESLAKRLLLDLPSTNRGLSIPSPSGGIDRKTVLPAVLSNGDVSSSSSTSERRRMRRSLHRASSWTSENKSTTTAAETTTAERETLKRQCYELRQELSLKSTLMQALYEISSPQFGGASPLQSSQTETAFAYYHRVQSVTEDMCNASGGSADRVPISVGLILTKLNSEFRAQVVGNASSEEETAGERKFHAAVVKGLSDVCRRSEEDCRMLAYWLGVAYYLSREVNCLAYPSITNPRRRHSVSPVITGCLISASAGGAPQRPIEEFDESLLRSALETYEALLSNIYSTMDSLIERLIAAVVGPSISGVSGEFDDTTRDFVALLSAAYQFSQDSALPTLVVQQLFCQLFHYVDCSLLNAMLGSESSEDQCGGESGSSAASTSRALCTGQGAFRIKHFVGKLEDWLSRINLLAQARDFLATVSDAVNVVVLDKSVVMDPRMGLKAFGSLNPWQVTRLLRNFSPDSLVRERVDPAVFDRCDSLCREREERGEKPVLLVDAYAHIPIAQLSL